MGENDGVRILNLLQLMCSPIAFHTMSVLSQEPNFKALESDRYSHQFIRSLLSECIEIARRQNCTFSKSHVSDVIFQMTTHFPIPNDNGSLDPNLLTTMYQDLVANRPLEFEVYLGNPVRMAEDLGISVPNLVALYAIARHVNKSRTKGDGPRSPQIPLPRQMNAQPPRPSMQSINGRGRGIGPRSFSDGPPVHANGRGRPMMNGQSPNKGGHHHGAFDNDLDQFRDIAMYGDTLGVSNENIEPKGTNGDADVGFRGGRPPPPIARTAELEFRSRELQLRERELQLRERELEMQRRGRLRHNNVPSTIMDDDEDEDDGRSQMAGSQRRLMTNDNVDMMSVTGRKSRNKGSLPTNPQTRNATFMGGDPNVSSGGRLMSLTGGRGKSRAGSAVGISQATFDPLNENPLMGFTSNRYPGVDTRTLAANSRANSLTSQRMDELGMGPGSRTASLMGGGGAYPIMSRGPPPRGGGMPPQASRGRPPPPHDYGPPGISRGYHDPAALAAPALPAKDLGKVRSTTGSASASSASLGGNGESHSSSSSLEPPRYHVRV